MFGIEYSQPLQRKSTDKYGQILKEASDYFAGQRISMTGEGYREILTEDSLFQEYVTRLTKGLNASEAEEVATLMANNRVATLGESSISGITPISSLAQPVIRKLWPRLAMKNAIPTEPVKLPKFSISWQEPYMYDAEGKRYPLPMSVRNLDNGVADRDQLFAGYIKISDALEGFDILKATPGGASIAVGDSIDPVFNLVKVKMDAVDATGANPESKEVDVKITLDINNLLFGEVSAKHSDGTVTKDTIFGSVDRATGMITARSMKDKIKEFQVLGYLSSEYNTRTLSVGFDVKRRDITIGTGKHIDAPLPIEWLQDSMALYNIDAGLDAVELMTNVVSQKLDLQIIEFYIKSFMNTGATYHGSFNCRPAAYFAGGPKDWKEEIKDVIDFFASKMKKDTQQYNGSFVIFGCHLDMRILPNVDWVFNHVTDDRGGVEVDYNLGAFSGINKYSLVSSDNIPSGSIYMVFIPSANQNQMTYKYYPYTFNVEKGYRSPNRPDVPSIMMTKRHTIEELLPMICKIDILNNDGTLPSTIVN